MGEIVVGVERSRTAVAALRWAAEQARVSGSRLRGVHAVALARSTSSPGVAGAPVVEKPLDELDRTYVEQVASVWDSVRPESDWELQFIRDAPGPTLVAQSSHASLLVVGTRDHVGINRIVSGSVSHYCLSHASCPVVAVPPTDVPPRSDGSTSPAEFTGERPRISRLPRI